MLAVLGALGPHVGGPGQLLGLMLAVPGRSWAENWPWPEREGDLAPLLGRMLAVLGV